MSALSLPDISLAVYAVLNIIAFLIFANDKRKAKNNAWRTPENLLLAVAALGPFGAFGAMLIFRHKTRKLKFYLVPVFLFIHCAAILYWSGKFSATSRIGGLTGKSYLSEGTSGHVTVSGKRFYKRRF